MREFLYESETELMLLHISMFMYVHDMEFTSSKLKLSLYVFYCKAIGSFLCQVLTHVVSSGGFR